jgi:hypothetical protein
MFGNDSVHRKQDIVFVTYGGGGQLFVPQVGSGSLVDVEVEIVDTMVEKHWDCVEEEMFHYRTS